ncbi:hypothetical protein GMPD_11690 [Geomonas paludis]|nr:hypothetical protein GMPD_11690 [Geomonas paludis]
MKDEGALVQVWFKKGETVLDKRARETIAGKLPALRGAPGARFVVGGCPSGREPAQVHEARCRAVRDYLLQQRIDAARVRVASTCRIKRDAVPEEGEIITIVRE